MLRLSRLYTLEQLKQHALQSDVARLQNAAARDDCASKLKAAVKIIEQHNQSGSEKN